MIRTQGRAAPRNVEIRETLAPRERRDGGSPSPWWSPARAALFVIGLYRRFVSPLLPRHCRYEPTCSAYATDAIRIHGLVKGGWLAVRRIGRCHPWGPGGIDHVPGTKGG
ncbi:MAG TPA: membrane protein insertion efficiency factor YidD [Actinomycetota bacterium]|nr:membrane protein insertion efficiency factor YidD [Actinomycetota bacterium]